MSDLSICGSCSNAKRIGCQRSHLLLLIMRLPTSREMWNIVLNPPVQFSSQYSGPAERRSRGIYERLELGAGYPDFVASRVPQTCPDLTPGKDFHWLDTGTSIGHVLLVVVRTVFEALLHPDCGKRLAYHHLPTRPCSSGVPTRLPRISSLLPTIHQLLVRIRCGSSRSQPPLSN